MFSIRRSLCSCRGGKILVEDFRELRRVVADQARRFKMTPMIGRSHGIHAEPITFGLKLALMFDEFGRAPKNVSRRHSDGSVLAN